MNCSVGHSNMDSFMNPAESYMLLNWISDSSASVRGLCSAIRPNSGPLRGSVQVKSIPVCSQVCKRWRKRKRRKWMWITQKMTTEHVKTGWLERSAEMNTQHILESTSHELVKCLGQLSRVQGQEKNTRLWRAYEVFCLHRRLQVNRYFL